VISPRSFFILVGLAAVLGGCAGQLSEVGVAPAISPVAYESQVARHPRVGGAPDGNRTMLSLWTDNGADLYRDSRALKVGDVLTINILIEEKAKLDNKTNRSRESTVDAALSFLFGPGTSGSGNYSISSKSSSKGEGGIDRTEEIKLNVAAVVKAVFPNKNLLIEGSQEILVNHELRVLQIAGIVRPGDITRNNTISYEKIAEARVAYGGRGRLMEVQQPAWGHQVYDAITPF
jgi:flagellar L-ring protein precursor FlgH